jgi:hypothetical protein
MDQSGTPIAPIIGIVCESRQGNFHIIEFDEMDFDEINMQSEYVQLHNLYLYHSWYNSIIVCTEEILNQLKQELQIA